MPPPALYLKVILETFCIASMSQLLVSIDESRLILGVETSFDTLLGNPSQSLYGKKFEIFIGPSTDFDLLNNVIMNAGRCNSSTDIVATLYELDGHPRLMLISAAPCTRIQDHPICCLLTLNDQDAFLPGSCPWRPSCAAAIAPAILFCAQSQSDTLAREADASLAAHAQMRFRTEYIHSDQRSGKVTPVFQSLRAIAYQRIRHQQVALDDSYARLLLRRSGGRTPHLPIIPYPDTPAPIRPLPLPPSPTYRWGLPCSLYQCRSPAHTGRPGLSRRAGRAAQRRSSAGAGGGGPSLRRGGV
jgi:hypothetical protein